MAAIVYTTPILRSVNLFFGWVVSWFERPKCELHAIAIGVRNELRARGLDVGAVFANDLARIDPSSYLPKRGLWHCSFSVRGTGKWIVFKEVGDEWICCISSVLYYEAERLLFDLSDPEFIPGLFTAIQALD